MGTAQPTGIWSNAKGITIRCVCGRTGYSCWGGWRGIDCLIHEGWRILHTTHLEKKEPLIYCPECAKFSPARRLFNCLIGG